MNTYEKMRRSLRDRKLKHMISGRELSAADITKAVDTLIGWARRDEAEGVRKDLILFDFEARFEEISDEIVKLSDRGEAEAYRDIYAKLYEFSEEMMADSYMPLYLFILYRYANALLGTGEAHRATELFDKLCEGTERLIGIDGVYEENLRGGVWNRQRSCDRSETLLRKNGGAERLRIGGFYEKIKCA